MYKHICIPSLLVLTLSSCSFGPHPCDTPTLKILARAYTLSVDPFEAAAFKNFIAKGPDAFTANSRVVECAKTYSNELAQSGASRAGSDRAIADSVNQQMELLGGSPASSGVTQGGGMLLAAQELAWLAEILPSAADGDFSQFNRGNPWRAEIDQLAKQTSQLTEIMGMKNLTDKMRAQQREANEQYFVQLGQQMFGD